MRISRILMGTLYITAGAAHFLLTRTYQRAMPGYLPAHRELVLISGAAEIAGGLGVMLPEYFGIPTRRLAAWGLVILLICVMPANIWMVQHPERFRNIPVWALWLRLPLQLPLIWWAWHYTHKVSATHKLPSELSS